MLPEEQRSHLGAELDQNHVLVRGGVPDDLHVLHDIVERRHELHEVVAGHGGWNGEDADHGAAPHVFRQRRHFTAGGNETAMTRVRSDLVFTPTRSLLMFLGGLKATSPLRTCFTCFLLGLVEVHDPMDDLH